MKISVADFVSTVSEVRQRYCLDSICSRKRNINILRFSQLQIELVLLNSSCSKSPKAQLKATLAEIVLHLKTTSEELICNVIKRNEEQALKLNEKNCQEFT